MTHRVKCKTSVRLPSLIGMGMMTHYPQHSLAGNFPVSVSTQYHFIGDKTLCEGYIGGVAS
jgi:hypothetical protein